MFFISKVIVLSDTYWTLITGSRYWRTFCFSALLFSPTNLLISNISSLFSDVNNTKTTADHWDEESLVSFIVPDFRYCCISFTSEWSPSSFRQWNRLMDFSGESMVLIFSLMYSTVFSLLSDLLVVCFIIRCRIIRLDSTDKPRRNRRKRSRCPFLLCRASSTALWCSSDNKTCWNQSFTLDHQLCILIGSNKFLLLFIKERCTYRAARCSWMLRWTKQKTFPWYKPNSSLKIWVHNPEYTDASVTPMPHSFRSSS